MAVDEPLCADTLRKAALMARSRAKLAKRRYQDGMARLGAVRALEQLAADLEATADYEDGRRRPKR